MGKCQIIRAKRRRLCVADLEHEIKVLDRTIVPPSSGSTDYTIDFNTDEVGIVFSSIQTPNGVTIFEGTNIEQKVTHVFGLYYDSTYTAEDYVLFENRLFRILDVNDLDERHEWTLLSCVERGFETEATNFA